MSFRFHAATFIAVAATATIIGLTSPATGNAAPSSSSGCYPTTSKGHCYEPGEFCRSSDHGSSGVSGGGEKIVCANNDGWRWEPTS